MPSSHEWSREGREKLQVGTEKTESHGVRVAFRYSPGLILTVRPSLHRLLHNQPQRAGDGPGDQRDRYRGPRRRLWATANAARAVFLQRAHDGYSAVVLCCLLLGFVMHLMKSVIAGISRLGCFFHQPCP